MILASMIGDLFEGVLTGLAFGLVGLAMLAIGWLVVDLLTPGKLAHVICDERNWNAAALVAANLLAISAVVTTSIATSHDEFVKGLLDSIGYGLLGVALQALAFFVIDKLTPGHLGTILTGREPHPAVLISVGASIGMGAVIAAAIA